MSIEALDSILLQASELNRHGTLADDRGFSFESFRRALYLLLTKTSTGHDIISAADPTLLRSANSLIYQPHLYHMMLSSRMNQSASTPCPPDPCIFSKSFVFRPDEDTSTAASQRIRTYMAMLFFNLAAIIHTNSSTLRHPEYSLRVALELYDVGFDLLLQAEDGGGASSTDNGDYWATDDISLAILSNMAEIHWTLAEFAKCTKILELQQWLLDIVQSNMRPSCYSEQEMELFAMNGQLLQAPSGAAAA